VNAQLELFESRSYELPPTNTHCLDCGVDTLASDNYYLVRDEICLETNPAERAMLCLDCLAAPLARPLTRADLPVPWPDLTIQGSINARISRNEQAAR
jgi:hypothetical protein